MTDLLIDTYADALTNELIDRLRPIIHESARDMLTEFIDDCTPATFDEPGGVFGGGASGSESCSERGV